MDVVEQIKRFNEFIETNYKDELLKRIRKDERFLVMDFNELAKFDIDLANLLLDQPEETTKAVELAIEQFEDIKGVKARFSNLPETQRNKIVELRSKHLGTFIKIVGEITGRSDVLPQATSARFECPSCGNILNVLQITDKFVEPTRCGCGRKGRFRQISKELVDVQELSITDPAENLSEGEQPQSKTVLLKDDLTRHELNKTLYIYGARIVINGVCKEFPVILRSGAKSTKFLTIIEANHVEPGTEESKQFEPTPEEEEEFKEMSNNPETYNKLIEAIEPTIYGNERVKEGILLQSASGVRRMLTPERVRRGDFHVFLIGDPSTGKSVLINFASKLLPRGRLASGKGVSGPGICAAVVKNEIVGGNRADVGSMVLAHKSIIGIDEWGDIDKDQLAYLNPAMEQQMFHLDKAGVKGTFITQTRVIAGANPKLGRFDPYSKIIDQFDIEPQLLTRFGLIFPFKDVPDKKRDEELAEHMLNLNIGVNTIDKTKNIFFETNKLRKYIQCALKFEPEFTKEAIDEIKNYYVDTRNPEQPGEIIVISLTPIQLEDLLRISEASAKLRFSKKVEKIDAKRAINIMQFSLKEVGFDKETGKVDIDRITGYSASERDATKKIKEIIIDMERSNKMIDEMELINEAKDKGISEERVDEVIKILKREGWVFSPRKGFIMRY